MPHATPPIGIYEKAIKPQSWDAMFRDTATAGFQNFELSLDASQRRLERLEWNVGQLRDVSRAAQSAGIQIFSACLSAHRSIPFGSADPDIRAHAMKIFRSAIRLCCELSVRVIQVAGYDVFYEPHTPETEKRYFENLSIAVHWAEQVGVMLAIEPVEVFLTDVAKSMAIVNEIGSPWLNVYPDIANMAGLGIDPVPQLSLGKGHTIAVHVREAQPDYFLNVLPFGSGIVDFDGCFRQLHNIGFLGPVTIEMWNEENPDYWNVIANARAFIQDKLSIFQSEF